MPEKHDANLIRRVLDGEATAEERRALDAATETDAALRDRIASEERLRERVHAIMGSAAAPASLHDAIRAGWNDAAGSAPAANESLSFTAAQEEQRQRQALRQGGPRLNLLALAASIAIILGAVGIGIFGTPLFTGSSDVVTPIADIKSYIANEHVRCASDGDVLKQKAKYRDPVVVERELTLLLGEPVRVIDLSSAGFRFIGGGPCHVPPAGSPSGHLLYQAGNGRMVSVFVEPYQDGVAIQPGRVVTDVKVGLSGASAIWTDESLIYMVVVCNSTDLDAVTRLTQNTVFNR